jgi:hypothetical protein
MVVGQLGFLVAAASDRRLLIQQIPALPSCVRAGCERRYSKLTYYPLNSPGAVWAPPTVESNEARKFCP